jgi:hypothetical protein
MAKWISILDASVVRVGMQCRTCLDWDHLIDESDDGDGGRDNEWFEATVREIHKQRHDSENNNSPMGFAIAIERKDHGTGDIWSVFLYSDNLEYFEVKLNAWDD